MLFGDFVCGRELPGLQCDDARIEGSQPPADHLGRYLDWRRNRVRLRTARATREEGKEECGDGGVQTSRPPPLDICVAIVQGSLGEGLELGESELHGILGRSV